MCLIGMEHLSLGEKLLLHPEAQTSPLLYTLLTYRNLNLRSGSPYPDGLVSTI